MSKPIVEVQHIGQKSDGGFATSRLMVNGHGVANWRSFVPVTDEANGMQYAEEVARCLRVALGVTDPEVIPEPLCTPNGMLWGRHSLAPFQRMVKYLGVCHRMTIHHRNKYAYELECGHTVYEPQSIDLTNLRRARRRCDECKSILDAKLEIQERDFVLVRTGHGLVLRKRPKRH